MPVAVRNNGAGPAAFFVDARLATTATLTLPTWPPGNNSVALPLTTDPPQWLVPTDTSGIEIAAQASLPIEFDDTTYNGSPDIVAPTTGTSVTASYVPTGGTVQSGIWGAIPDEIGPYAGPAPAGTATMTLSATTMPFDPAVTSSTGDLWLGYAAYAGFQPLILNAGRIGTIYVTITPSGSSGTVVTGNLYVDDFVNGLPPYGGIYGDEVAVFPYSYKIK